MLLFTEVDHFILAKNSLLSLGIEENKCYEPDQFHFPLNELFGLNFR
jgi:hypothetical protein